MADTLPRLTPAQERQLVDLKRFGAVAEATACGPYESACPINPLVLGKLRDLELAASRVVRKPGGSQFTAYWLTPAGVERARQLQRAPNG